MTASLHGWKPLILGKLSINAQSHVYLVPLNGGVRIGLCAIPTNDIPRVAQALAESLQ